MTNIGIDEIISKLSSKFNRVFYDREFVGCVCEDLQTIIGNENKCCVLVFPALSPNYLRVVRYQAKLFDLAVFTLSSGSVKSVGVCHRKYFLSNPTGTDDTLKIKDPCTKQMAENASSSTRKRRPPIQLYVPPAQRRSRLSEKSNTQKDYTRSESNQKISGRFDKEKCKPNFVNTDKTETDVKKERKVFETVCSENKPGKENVQNGEVKEDGVLENCNLEVKKEELQNTDDQNDFCLCTEDIDYLLPDKQFSCPIFRYQCNCMKFLLFKDIFPYAKLLIFSIKRMKHSFHCIRWGQKSENILVERDMYKVLEKCSIIDIHRLLVRNISKNIRFGLFGPNILDFREIDHSIKEFSDFQNTYYLCGDSILCDLPKNNNCYLPVPQYEIFDDELKPQDYLDFCQNSDNGSLYLEEFIKSINSCIVLPSLLKTDDLSINSLLDIQNRTESPEMPCEKDEVNYCDKIVNTCAKQENTSELINNTPQEKKVPKETDRVIVLEERMAPPKTGSKSPPRIKDKGKQNEHEQEKEIMRKAKQNINRKTRPIIKYVDDDNDTLKIGKGDNVNNWEELFNEDGELQEDIFTEIIQKVGPEVTIVKAAEDYSAYASKQAEDLEHMVELYDFPPTLETHDIISAFSAINSDSMYVKWVDDTRALLVLGSSIQAQKAIELSNSLIKVRPMSAASSLALEKAHQSDLKPAMKRPQTNLQTARRLITTHLGAKSRVSKEQSAKEREDLRVAKEMKKLAKQNEKDAWEGNLRSAIN